MREIKFRVWDKLIGEMTDVLTIDFKTKGVNDDEYYNMTPSLDGEYELMQYTGLKDKNGKEIYEGDIVLVDGHWKGNVHFHLGCFMVDEDVLGAIHSFSEVIGNIYENPELLEHHNG